LLRERGALLGHGVGAGGRHAGHGGYHLRRRQRRSGTHRMDWILLPQVGDFRLRSLGDWRAASTATTARFRGRGIIIAAFGAHRLNVGVRTLLDIALALGKGLGLLCRFLILGLGGGLGWCLGDLRLGWRWDLGRFQSCGDRLGPRSGLCMERRRHLVCGLRRTG
jgi:hypothetical protein